MYVWVLCGVCMHCVRVVVSVCVCVVSCAVRVLRVCGVCAESVCGICVSCFGVAVCCAVSLCVVLVLVLVCNVWCEVSVVCGVWRGLARGKTLCVLVQNVTCARFAAFCRYTRKCLEPTHRDVGGWVLFPLFLSPSLSPLSLSLVPSLFLSSCFSLSSVVLFLRSLSLLLSLFSSLSVTMTMITRPSRLSLCTHGSDL